MHIYNWCHSNVTDIHYVHEYRLQHTWRNPLAFYLSLLNPFCSPFESPLLTWNPPSCDRIRPPWSQVACKLTSPFSTLPQSLPSPNSQNPGYQAPHYDDLKNPASSVRNSKFVACPHEFYTVCWHLFGNLKFQYLIPRKCQSLDLKLL